MRTIRPRINLDDVLAGEGHAEMDVAGRKSLIVSSPFESLHILDVGESLGLEEFFRHIPRSSKT
jgi:hypothetical protein